MYSVDVCYFPTQVILIDDDVDFLQTVTPRLSEKFLLKVFPHPQEALKYLEDTHTLIRCITPSVLIDQEADSGESYLSLSKMNVLAKNTVKKNMPTVIVSDYSMPGMSGIEFFEKISASPIIKILLTGNGDLELALYALNRGIVDKFLLKKSDKLMFEIEQNIMACQHKFFKRFSYPLMNYLSIPSDSVLRKHSLSSALNNIIEDEKIIEYYLIDNIGSYLLLNDDAKILYLITLIDRQFDEYLDIAVQAKAPQKVIERLKNRTHAPVFLDSSAYELSPAKWLDLMKAFEKNNYGYSCLVK